MSTYWYFECMDHNPPLQSDDEFTQHTDDAAYKHALELVASRPLQDVDCTRDYFDSNARRFLAKHPTCRIGLINEYGKRAEHEELPMTDPLTDERLAEAVPMDSTAAQAEEIVKAAIAWRWSTDPLQRMSRAEWELVIACEGYGDKFKGVRDR